MKLKRKIQTRDWINIAAILLLIALFVWVGVMYTRTFGKVNTGDLVSSGENLRAFITSYGGAGIVVMTLLHTLQVVISFIPSVIVQFVGGMIYGLPVGLVTGIIGITIGTAVSFYLSRLLGRRIVTLFVSENSLDKIEKLLSSNISAVALLILYILPTPKDFFAYFIGLTDMKARKLFLISFAGRLPGQILATYLGAHVLERNYVLVGIVIGVCVVVTVLFFVFKNRILARLGKGKAD
ncbi:MAG: VTT domain-containing protein [Firmicutes bacterium]|nr:VTT domain-containing protein [Bacillota bacterium]